MLQPLQPRPGPEPSVPVPAGDVSEARANPPAAQEKENELISITSDVTPPTREAIHANASGRVMQPQASIQPQIGEGFGGNGIPPNEVSGFAPGNLPAVIVDELDDEVFLSNRSAPAPPGPPTEATGNTSKTDNTATTTETVVNSESRGQSRRLPNNIADLNQLLASLTEEYSNSPSVTLKDQLEAVATKVHQFEWQAKPLAAISEAKNNLEIQINASSDPQKDLGLIRMMKYKVLCQLEETARQELGPQQAEQLMVLDRTMTTSEKILDLTSLETEAVTSSNAGRQVTYYLSLISTIINPAGQIIGY